MTHHRRVAARRGPHIKLHPMRHLRQEFDRLTIKELITYALAIGCMAAATVAIFLGLYLPCLLYTSPSPRDS